MKKFLKKLQLVLIASIFFSFLSNTSFAAALKIVAIKDLSATVYNNQSYSLPAEIIATMSNKTTRKVVVTWNKKNAITSKIGKFVYRGTVKGYSKQVLLTLEVMPLPVYRDPQLARAVSLGIGTYSKNAPVTYKQFFKMLDVAVELSNPNVLHEWKDKFPEARISNQTMRREEGMLAVFFAAKSLGSDYCATNSQWWKVNELIGDTAWDKMSWEYPLFPGWEQPIKLGDNDCKNHMTAAYFYSMGRISMYNEALIFDFDSKSVSMRPADSFTYEEALCAALRLHDSCIKVTERVRAKEDEEILRSADERRNAILNSKTTVKVTGTTYYVSNSGNDNNDGRSPETAWATIAKVNSMTFNAGDGVLFDRGGLWRGIPHYRSNITYSAYGEGPKPKIYGSPENGAGTDKWTLLNGTNNIWVFYKDMYDTSCIVFDNGKSWGTRKTAIWDGTKYVDLVNSTVPFDLNNLKNLEFSSQPDYTGYSTKDAHISLDKKGKLYLKCDAGNPGSVYGSIEFLSNPMRNENGEDWGLVRVGTNSVVDNLCVMYGNQCGIVLEGNSIAQNCEVSWCGGTVINFNGAWLGDNVTCTIRGGDGIVLSNGSNSSVINNYVHHIYDNAITDELGILLSDNERYAKNMTIKGNLAEACSGGLLLCDWKALQSNEENRNLFQNFLIEDNYILYCGYGWSHQSLDYDFGYASDVNNGNCNIFFGFPAKSGRDIYVKNNVFYLSKYALVGGRHGAKGQSQRYEITFSGNTYGQNTLGILTLYPALDDYKYSEIYILNLNAKKTVSEILGDKTGVVLKP